MVLEFARAGCVKVAEALKTSCGAFLKRNVVSLLVILVLAVEGLAVAEYTERRVTAEVTEAVTAELRAGFQRYIEQQEQERQAASILTGEASRIAALNADADWLARLAGPYKTRQMQLSVIWNALVRVANQNYPNTVEEVVKQKEQWMFFSETNPIKADVRSLAMEQLELFREGRYPAGLDNSFVYGEWSAKDYVLRDRWEKDSKTNYWRYPET